MPSDILVVRGGSGFAARLARSMGEEYTIHHETVEENARRRLASVAPELILFFPPPGRSADRYGFCAALKASPLTRDIPVVVLSGQSSVASKTEAFAAGAVDYLVRPFAPLEVHTRISSLLTLRRTARRLVTQTSELSLTKFMFLKGMASLAETRDPETGDHLMRVSKYMKTLVTDAPIQEACGQFFCPAAAAELCRAAMLHDIGKVGVSDTILLKPGRLTEEEFEIMKQHALHGERIIKKLMRANRQNVFLCFAAEIAGGHHESWNGKGYPRGLKETEIPLSARLMAVADVYDSVISPRVYKKAQSHASAVEYIMDNKGLKFDPVIADGFYRLREKFEEIACRLAPCASTH